MVNGIGWHAVTPDLRPGLRSFVPTGLVVSFALSADRQAFLTQSRRAGTGLFSRRPAGTPTVDGQLMYKDQA